jgi:hypothetical protein
MHCMALTLWGTEMQKNGSPGKARTFNLLMSYLQWITVRRASQLRHGGRLTLLRRGIELILTIASFSVYIIFFKTRLIYICHLLHLTEPSVIAAA